MTHDLVIVRHGETAGQSSIRLYGVTDIPLSDLGRTQMSRVRDALRDCHFATTVTSPLARARESTNIICDNGTHPAPRIVKGFREIDFGDWEGMTYAEVADTDPEGYGRWKDAGSLSRFPGGDDKQEFFTRVGKAAREVLEHATLPVLAVLHKGVIRGILASLLRVDVTALSGRPIELGSIHRLDRTADGWVIVSANETGHLGNTRISHS